MGQGQGQTTGVPAGPVGCHVWVSSWEIWVAWARMLAKTRGTREVFWR